MHFIKDEKVQKRKNNITGREEWLKSEILERMNEFPGFKLSRSQLYNRLRDSGLKGIKWISFDQIALLFTCLQHPSYTRAQVREKCQGDSLRDTHFQIHVLWSQTFGGEQPEGPKASTPGSELAEEIARLTCTPKKGRATLYRWGKELTAWLKANRPDLIEQGNDLDFEAGRSYSADVVRLYCGLALSHRRNQRENGEKQIKNINRTRKLKDSSEQPQKAVPSSLVEEFMKTINL